MLRSRRQATRTWWTASGCSVRTTGRRPARLQLAATCGADARPRTTSAARRSAAPFSPSARSGVRTVGGRRSRDGGQPAASFDADADGRAPAATSPRRPASSSASSPSTSSTSTSRQACTRPARRAAAARWR